MPVLLRSYRGVGFSIDIVGKIQILSPHSYISTYHLFLQQLGTIHTQDIIIKMFTFIRNREKINVTYVKTSKEPIWCFEKPFTYVWIPYINFSTPYIHLETIREDHMSCRHINTFTFVWTLGFTLLQTWTWWLHGHVPCNPLESTWCHRSAIDPRVDFFGSLIHHIVPDQKQHSLPVSLLLSLMEQTKEAHLLLITNSVAFKNNFQWSAFWKYHMHSMNAYFQVISGKMFQSFTNTQATQTSEL